MIILCVYVHFPQVIPSRIAMAVPGMVIPPVILSRLERTANFVKNPWMRAPTMVLFA